MRKGDEAMLISLACPRCRKDLAGENNSKVFFCLHCRLALDISEDPPKQFELFFTDARIHKESPLVYFPFWQINSEYKIVSGENQPGESRRRRFYVSAFFIKNIDYFGDIGYYLTENNIQLGPGLCRDYPVFPADRGLRDCITYPRIFLYKEESKKNRRVFDIHIDHKEVSIGLVPFYRIGTEYYDSLIFWKYPSGALV